jgi:hypothetical protein
VKNAIRYAAVALISVGATLAAVHKAAPSAPTTCAEAERERTISLYTCSHGCSHEEAERYVRMGDLSRELCQKEADQQKAHEEALTRDADKEWDRLHPGWQKEANDALDRHDDVGFHHATELLTQREDFEKKWVQDHIK